MPPFAYRAIATGGEMIEGRMEARDAEAVIRHLRDKGHLPVSAEPAMGTVKRGRLAARPRDVAVAVREMALLLGAGQTVEQALRLMASGAAPKRLQPAFAAALEALRGGAGLADALDEVGGFPPLVIAMVRAGEAGGVLEPVMGRLADLLDRAVRMRETLVSALIYPSILVVVAIAAVLLLLLQVVPQFAPLFANAKTELPLSTRAVLAASAWLRENWTSLMAGVLAALLAGPRVVGRLVPDGGWDRVVLRLPGVGSLVAIAATVKLARTLGVLLKCAVPLPAALALSREVVGNRVMAQAVAVMAAGVRDGKSLADSLPAGAPLPPMAVKLLRVGEESGRLDEVLGHLADIYDAKLEQALKRFFTVLEPACVLALSVVIGGIVVSILMAVVSINELAF
ncbi:MAG TPA: type II secretion system F family protein [Azospirillaceae bacterium]|nr:type II secretion system F family protein [Azospirillaceae bacterium]